MVLFADPAFLDKQVRKLARELAKELRKEIAREVRRAPKQTLAKKKRR
jgi:hypothetical protein